MMPKDGGPSQQAAPAGGTPQLVVVDVGTLINQRSLSRLQVFTVGLCCLVALLDGMDTFSIGVAAPSITAELGIPLARFGLVFSAALFGAMSGAFTFGPAADRFGCKRMLAGAVLLFAVFTFLVAFANSYASLVACCALAGLGLGGAPPCVLALAAGYVPVRSRAAVASLLGAAFPFGGMVGGLVNSLLFRVLDWHWLFYFGGLAPLLAAVLIAVAAPESLRVLLHRRNGRQKVARIVQRIAPDNSAVFDRSAEYVVDEVKLPGAPSKHLFTRGRAIATPALWLPCFVAFGVLIIAAFWIPALLRQQGMSGADAALVLAMHSAGAFAGMVLAGRLTEKFGLYLLMPSLVVGAVLIGLIGHVGTSLALAAVCDGLIGCFIGTAAAGLIAFSALSYPLAMRPAGLGWALGMGRLGQVFAPLLLGALLRAGWSAGPMFAAIAAGPLLAAVFVPIANHMFKSGQTAELRRQTSLLTAA